MSTNSEKLVNLDDKDQSKQFFEKAREIEADERTCAAADELMLRMARLQPQPKTRRRNRK
jgi:hypothetical protein